ncbi:MAG: PQQ-like beta-propeller repeat protein [Candidatus Aegiribacteria sp.]|nr:PQQ-like beta-propeller repeat protein [Candidatus Aegiribacteria sp.]
MLSLVLSILILAERVALPVPQAVAPNYVQPPQQLPVEVELISPPPGQIYVEDLWRVRLYNTSSEIFSVYMFITVEIAGAGLIMDATTGVFLLPPGIVNLSSVELSPINTEFYDSEFEASVNRMGEFPDGTYMVTFYVYEEGGGLIGQDGFTQEVENHTPPELQYPIDNSEITEPLPLFTWFPSLPPGTVDYEIRIVEILTGQSPESAISANPAWFTAGGLLNEEIIYPIYADGFEDGHRYAWQVEGFYSGNSVGTSEVWTFSSTSISTTFEEGSELWSFETGDRVVCSPAISLDGSIICGSLDGFIYSLDQGGSELWRYAAGGGVYSVAVGPDGRIFATGDFGICCVDPSGFLLWHNGMTGPVDACPVILPSGRLYAGSLEGVFYSIDGVYGDIIDSLRTGDSIYLPCSVDSTGRIYFACDDMCIAIQDNEDGLVEIWSYRTDDDFTGGPVIDGDYIYAAAGRKVFRFSRDGAVLWNTVLPSQVYTGPVVSSDGTVWAGTGSGNVYALERETGRRIGVIPVGAVITSTPALNVTGSMFFGADNGCLHSFSPSGFSLWKFQTLGTVRSSPVIGIDGTVYFGSDDHRIYAVTGSGAGPMTEGWPQFCRNSFNNGFIDAMEIEQ